MHLHIGSQITSVEPYRQALAAALDIVEEVEAAAGVRLRFLNAGGGFAVPYREAPVTCHPSDYFCSLLTADDYAEVVGGGLEARRPDLELFLEPGRSIAATTAVLVSRVENEKTKGRRDAAGRRIGDERWLTVDAGFNTLLEHTNYHWYYRTVVANRAGEEADAEFRLAGPLCDGGDVFAGDADSAYRWFPRGDDGRRRGRVPRRRRLHARDDEPVQRPPHGRGVRRDRGRRARADPPRRHRRRPRRARPHAGVRRRAVQGDGGRRR